ncbi:MAG: adenylate/guanylate cyclase domain-containing protein [Alphaproteobacteria bacterium]|nr:adenylate/guanylate cyclase domain-containing protein [Alphaproteobacteria bacterium]
MARLLTNRLCHAVLLVALLLGAVFAFNPDGALRQRLQFLVFDHYIQVKPRPATDLVKIVDIDDESLARTGQWPWPRTVVADLVTRLSAMGAKVIAFDGVLAEPDRTSPAFFLETFPDGPLKDRLVAQTGFQADNDALLARAIRESGIFVAGFTHGSNPKAPRVASRLFMTGDIKKYFLTHSHYFDKTALFLPGLEAAAAGNGSFMARPEIDSVIRKTELLFSDGITLYPALNLEALRVSLKPQNLFFTVRANKNFTGNSLDQTRFQMSIGDTSIPLDENGAIWVYFRPFSRAVDYIPAYQVLDPAFHEAVAKKVRGRILFVGSTAEGLKDLRATPHDPFLPGVEIHANAAEQFLQNRFLVRTRAAIGAEALFMLGSGIVIILLSPFVGALGGLLVSLVFIALSFSASWFFFDREGVLLDPVYPSFVVTFLFVVSSTLSYIRTEAERRRVRDAFGLYISPDFMRELTADPGKLKLGGETRDLSVMFTDIRGFTTISEGLAPEELTRLMNDFLTPMSDVVMETRGTIDKYIGDAMMAFWNAPLDDPDHARHACRAALRMGPVLEDVNAALGAQAAELGGTPLVLRAGIGINSGPASVGNMGSRARFAYSALGDTVNLAARLEGQTKTYGVDILIGEGTQAAVSDFAALEIDLLQVKGKQKPVRAFVLLGDDALAKDPAFQALKTTHEAVLKAYRARQWADALTFLEAARRADKAGAMQTVYDLYGDRIAVFQKRPPGPDWDGVYHATSK